VWPRIPLRFVRWGGCGSGGSGSGVGRAATPPMLRVPTASCRAVDFMVEPFWRGHWVGVPSSPGARCPAGVCTGTIEPALPPNTTEDHPPHDGHTWVYRLPTCVFHLFSPREARGCLNGSWIFSNGDSNFPDTTRNLFEDALALDVDGWRHPGDTRWSAISPEDNVTRTFYFERVLFGRTHDLTGWRPEPRFTILDGHSIPTESDHVWPADLTAAANMTLRVTNVYNGGFEESKNYVGFAVAEMPAWRTKNLWFLRNAGGGSLDDSNSMPAREAGRGPDVLFINSGMHDGVGLTGHDGVVRDFATRVRGPVLDWFAQLLAWSVPTPNTSAVSAATRFAGCRPRRIWRHTVAPGGSSRRKPANPQKIEIFNRLVAAALLAENAELGRRRPGVTAWRNGAPALGGAPTEGGRARAPAHCTRPFHSDSDAWSFLDSAGVGGQVVQVGEESAA
jgi:hypothetical protein